MANKENIFSRLIIDIIKFSISLIVLPILLVMWMLYLPIKLINDYRIKRKEHRDNDKD